MKKLFIILGILLTFGNYACVNDDTVTREESNKNSAYKYNKTTEMLNFEKALRDWMSYKQQNKSNLKNAEINNIANELIVMPSRNLLLSLGIAEDEIEKVSDNTDELVSFTLKRYSQTLAEQNKINLAK